MEGREVGKGKVEKGKQWKGMENEIMNITLLVQPGSIILNEIAIIRLKERGQQIIN